MLQIRIEDNGGSRTLPLDRDLIVLGRSKKCTVRLNDSRISSRHCQIFRVEDAWYVQDLRSRNKTLLNDRPLEQRTILHEGDRLAMGMVRISVELSGSPAPSSVPLPVPVPEAPEVIVLKWDGELASPDGPDAVESCGDPSSPSEAAAAAKEGQPSEAAAKQGTRWGRLLVLVAAAACVAVAAIRVLREEVATGRIGMVRLPAATAAVPTPADPAAPAGPSRPARPGLSDPGARIDEPVPPPAAPVPDLLAAPTPPAPDTLVPSGPVSDQRVGPSAPTPAASASEVVNGAVGWLVRHQRPDGSWSCADFSAGCPDLNQQAGAARCGGPGDKAYDVGVTALATLALEGAGFHHMSDQQAGPASQQAGPASGNGDSVRRALMWLKDRQAPDGSFGGHEKKYAYGQALATLAFLQDLRMTKSPMLRQIAQRGVAFLLETQTTGAGWRYLPERKQSDSSVTTWVALCLCAAKKEGITVPEAATGGIRVWLLKKLDLGTGRLGYVERGDRGSRPADCVDKFPPLEAMAACGVVCRAAIGRKGGDPDVTKAVQNRLKGCLPVWDEEGGRVDEYYWFFGTLADRNGALGLHALWDPALKKALAGHQVKEGCGRGSWDPVDPWGKVGGRVYATAMGALAMELTTDGTLEALRP